MAKAKVIAIIVTLLCVTSSSGQQAKSSSSPFGGTYEGGVLTLDFKHIDDLLKLETVSGVRLVEVTKPSEAEVSSAHLALLLRWVERGGAVWFHQEGPKSSLFRKVNPGIAVKDFNGYLRKESGASFNAGELFVKDLLPQLAIASHAITANVEMLYVKPYSGRQEYLEMTNAQYVPIVSFTAVPDGLHVLNSNDSRNGKTFVLMAVVEKGSGIVLIDTTQLGSKDWKGPDGNEYDGPRFYRNIKNFGRR